MAEHGEHAAAREAKQRLRREVLAARDALDRETVAAAADRLFAAVAALPEYRAARAVLAYASFGSELPTLDFMRRVLADGKALLLPRIEREPRGLALHRVDDLAGDLVPGPWGIPQPDPARCDPTAPEAADFILMPGAVFDRDCNRLGYGAGFYDRLLGGLADRPPLVAAALELQVVDGLPVEPHDVPLDRVVTERAQYIRTP